MPREILTLNTKLYVNKGNGDENLIDLLSTPDLGVGDAEKIEVTNLQDGTRRYINGIKDVGDSLEFEFNYTVDTYDILKKIEDSKEIYTYKVVLPGENNVEDGLCFEFEAALSVKIAGAAVGEQIKMTINLTPYSEIKVGQYEDNAGQQSRYSTFTIGQSRARSAGTIKLVNISPGSIEELYINNVAQELPTGVTNDETDDRPAVITNYEVNPGDVVRIKGGFSLWETELPINNVVLQNDLKSCRMMFYGCTGLTETPIIPEGVENCSFMFDGCTGLTQAPVIPSSARDCSMMFAYCSSLTEAPVIPNGVTNCMGMFAGTGLTEAPTIPSSVTNCMGMFLECTNLTTIPQENIDLINNPQIGLVTDYCFAGCPLVADQIPSNWGGNAAPIYPVVEYTTFTTEETGTLFIANNSDEICVTELYVNNVPQQLPQFSYAELMTSELPMEEKIQQISTLQVTKGDNIKIKGGFALVNGIIPAECVPINNLLLQTLGHYEYMFYNYTGLTEVPSTLPVGNYTRTFSGTNITYAPFIDESSIIYYTFASCGNLRSIASEYIDAFNNNPLEDGGNGCFADSTNIEEPIAYSQIPMGWKNSN